MKQDFALKKRELFDLFVEEEELGSGAGTPS